MRPSVSVIVLTMGDRPNEVDALLESLEAQRPFDGVLVGNGTALPDRDGWTNFSLERNLGISGGRAYGARVADGDILVFIDDDAMVTTPSMIQDIRLAFAEDPMLGAIALRIVAEGSDRSLSEWQPRLRGSGQDRSGNVTWFPGGGHAIRADAYAEVGGYAENFWYSHEETDLAWRLLDAGYHIAYRSDLVLSHPATTPARHHRHLWFSARNRVWLARKHLPLPIGAAYSALWLGIQLLRSRSKQEAGAVLQGTIAGVRDRPGPRKPIRWRTAWRMAKLGRPPLI